MLIKSCQDFRNIPLSIKPQNADTRGNKIVTYQCCIDRVIRLCTCVSIPFEQIFTFLYNVTLLNSSVMVNLMQFSLTKSY